MTRYEFKKQMKEQSFDWLGRNARRTLLVFLVGAAILAGINNLKERYLTDKVSTGIQTIEDKKQQLKKIIMKEDYPTANYIIRPDGRRKRITADLKQEILEMERELKANKHASNANFYLPKANARTPDKFETYIVKYGDTLSEIAEDKGVLIGEIMYYNSQITNPNKIYANQELKIPKD